MESRSRTVILRPILPLRRGRGGRISSISALAAPTRGCVVLSSMPVYRERRTPRLNSRKVTGDAATHRRMCFTHAPSRSIDYFPPVGRKGRERRVGRITGPGERGDEKDGREASHFLLLALSLISWRLSLSVFPSYIHTRTNAIYFVRNFYQDHFIYI